MPEGPAGARGAGWRTLTGLPMRRSREGGLRVRVSDARGRTVRAGGLSAWLRRVAPLSASGTVNVALVTDARMRVLNRRYRRKDYATDVLSFPANPEHRRPAGPRPGGPSRSGHRSPATRHQRPAFAGFARFGAAGPATSGPPSRAPPASARQAQPRSPVLETSSLPPASRGVRHARQAIASRRSFEFWPCTGCSTFSGTITSRMMAGWVVWNGGCAARAVCRKA